MIEKIITSALTCIITMIIGYLVGQVKHKKQDYNKIKDDIKILNSGINQYWIDHAYIHRNMYPDEKDFGVPANRIKESYIQVK